MAQQKNSSTNYDELGDLKSHAEQPLPELQPLAGDIVHEEAEEEEKQEDDPPIPDHVNNYRPNHDPQLNNNNNDNVVDNEQPAV